VDPGSRTFILNGTTVQVTNGTEFDDGLRESDLQPGLQVSVEGEWDARGFLVADEIESRSADSEVEARILEYRPKCERTERRRCPVRVTSRTLIVDEDDDDRLSFGDLRVPETVEVDGIRREDSDGSVYLEAIKIEREDDDDDDEFQLTGRVDAVCIAQPIPRARGVDERDQRDRVGRRPGCIDDLQCRVCGRGGLRRAPRAILRLEVEREDD
jgi:hypothetical protein